MGATAEEGPQDPYGANHSISFLVPVDSSGEGHPAPARSVKVPGFVQPEGKEEMPTFLMGKVCDLARGAAAG